MNCRFLRKWLGMAFVPLLLVSCAADPVAPGSNTAWSPARQQIALTEANLLPASAAFESSYFDWVDNERRREVQAKLYMPRSASPEKSVPLIVFSHGLGGSREGYSYLGANWAAQGYASLHLQHAGSDRRLWLGNPFDLVARLQGAASEAEAIDRVRDLRFAIDQILAAPEVGSRLNARHIVAAGHSYGANTVLLASGAVFERPQGQLSYAERRLVGALVISAPPFHGEANSGAILRPIGIPILHITATGDEIRLPGYLSSYQDRVKVFSATGSPRKALVVFRDGSHSMFTDRLAPGGHDLNVQVKAATRDLSLAFFAEVLDGQSGIFEQGLARHKDLIAYRESNLDLGR
ncbi:hypothetical protein [Dechloromonas sp.]|uniref:alpha/beta hydrolase family protein n=1 Tax=Dechloromonas sp. TaxID=1917218 RepID=UPI00120E0DBE|nr:hypothetical protein [Dechloromonas sp.]MBU3697003.1 acetylhydrolase [Dechloromonas sp.]TEX49581.1 MAG: acetylhydrolase [Rhodocyclaceae bacterium]